MSWTCPGLLILSPFVSPKREIEETVIIETLARCHG